jgi:hypothetical protein
MSELARKFVRAACSSLGRFHRQPRYAVSVEAALSPAQTPAKACKTAASSGHTNDLSASGIGLVVDTIHDGRRYHAVGEGPFRLTLYIDPRPVSMLVDVRRYERLEAPGQGGFLLGLQIGSMCEADRAAYGDFLERCRQAGGSTARNRLARSLRLPDVFESTPQKS